MMRKRTSGKDKKVVTPIGVAPSVTTKEPEEAPHSGTTQSSENHVKSPGDLPVFNWQPSDIRTAIEKSLESVDFEPPVSVAYCTSLRDHLVGLFPDASVDVYHQYHTLIITVTAGVRVQVVTSLV